MSKSKYFTGQPIFSQLLSYLPQGRINSLAAEHDADRYYKEFRTYTHLVTMLYGIFNRCTGLREVTTGLLAWEHRIQHLGLNYYPKRSTISDANVNRASDVFESVYYWLFNRYQYFLPDSRSKNASRFYIVDSTTIQLFQEVLKNAGRKSVDGKRKGGIKVHTLIRSDQDVPCLIRYSAGAGADSPFLKDIHLPEGSILVFDRGYYDYKQYNRFSTQKITWVTRLRKDTVYTVLDEKSVSETEKSKGVISDQGVVLGHNLHKNNTRVVARLIKFQDPQTKEQLEFITNSKRFNASTITLFYKKRWQIESLFKRIKQNYPLRSFLGESENAIKIQIWCALIADLLLKLVKAKAGKSWSFSNLAAMVRLHLMTYINLFEFLKNPEKALIKNQNKSEQLYLFPT